MYSIGEISSMVNKSKDTLRHYDEMGVLKPCFVDPENGYRYYNHEQVKVIAKILEYKEYGFTLAQIKNLLDYDDPVVLQDTLAKQYDYLSERIEKLSGIRSRLKNKIGGNTMVNKNILIVDDSEFMRNVLTEILTNRGYAVVSSASGEEAVHLYDSEKPWLVLMDIAMPGGMDGFECTARLLEIDPDANVVMLSALDDEQNQKAAQVAGANAFISKPFKGDDLLDFISGNQTRFF